MELAGEVLSGCFFHGVPGLQFASHQAFRALQRKLPEDRVWWLNAADPASPCGLALDCLRGALPRRLPSTHLAYCGCELAMISEGAGKALTILVPPDDPRLQEVLAPLHHLLQRRFQPLRSIAIETINGDRAARSEYVDALRTSFDVVVDYKKVTVYRRIG